MDTKGAIHSKRKIVGDFNTSLTSTGRSSTRKINKEMMVLYQIISDRLNGHF